MKIIGKTASFIGAVFFVFMMASCKPEVDLFVHGEEMPAIYGLLDYKADTNFVKITKVILDDEDPTPFLMNPNLNCYPEKLDVRLVEYRNGKKEREIVMDALTNQLYYTTERLHGSSEQNNYSYDLIVVIDGKTIVSKADMVGGDQFRIVSAHLNFSKYLFGKQRFIRFGPALNAAFYDIAVYFHYKERRYPSTDTVDSVFTFIQGRYYKADLDKTLIDGYYYIYYRPEYFYTGLGKFLGDDTLSNNVWRYITDYPIQIVIEAGGMELLNYLKVYDQTMINTQTIPDLSCVGPGAAGLFSSRCRYDARGSLAGTTVPDLLDMGWGFKFIGGKEDFSTCENY